MDYSPPGSSVHGIPQGSEYWSGLPFPSPGILPRDQTQLSPITGGFFTAEPWAWLIRQVNTQCDQHGRQTLVGSLY